MIRTLTTILTLVSCAVPGATLASQASARNPFLKEELKAYASILKAKDNRDGHRDGEALKIMKEIISGIPKLASKDKRLVAKSLADTFRVTRRTPANAIVYDNAVAGLAEIGKYGAAPLRKLFVHKHLAKGKVKGRKDWYPLRVKILKALGNFQDGKTSEFLLKVALRNAESDVFLAAAGKALGEFENSSEAVRKPLSQKLIQELNRIFSLTQTNNLRPDNYDIQTPTFRRRYKVIKGPWTRTLQRLTRQKLSDPADWQRFWNKNKSKSWRAPSPGKKAKKKR